MSCCLLRQTLAHGGLGYSSSIVHVHRATHRDPCLRHKRNTDVAKLPCALMAINVLRSRYYATMGKCRSGLAAIPLNVRSPIAVADQILV